MNPNPGNDNSYLGAESGVRHAAMVVIDELGENAAHTLPREQWFSRNKATKSAPLPGAVSPQLSRNCSGREPPAQARAYTVAHYRRVRRRPREIVAIDPGAI
jgi:hypothetical protein